VVAGATTLSDAGAACRHCGAQRFDHVAHGRYTGYLPSAGNAMPEAQPRHPLRAALGGALERVLERLLALDPATRDALGPLDGRELSVALQAPPIALRLRVEQGRLRVGPDRGNEADLSVRATLGAVLAQLLPGRDAGAMPVGQVRISGDAELARRLQQLVQRYEPDVEEAFTRVFGDIVGVQIARALKRGLDWSRDTAASLARNSAEFLVEERRDVLGRDELTAFNDEVDALRDDVERLERRIARVRGRAANGGGKGT
jgi:ubiquinone biosynthesis protein UbiJ